MRATLPLLAPDEIRRLFARQYNDQILMIPGEYPFALIRLTHEEVDQLRVNVRHGRMSLKASNAPQLGAEPPAAGHASEMAQPVKRGRGRPRKEPPIE